MRQDLRRVLRLVALTLALASLHHDELTLAEVSRALVAAEQELLLLLSVEVERYAIVGLDRPFELLSVAIELVRQLAEAWRHRSLRALLLRVVLPPMVAIHGHRRRHAAVCRLV